MSGTSTGPLAITGMGAISAVGANAAQTCTSIRAGLGGFSEHPSYVSLALDAEWEMGEALVAGQVPGLDPKSGGVARLLELALPALSELGRSSKLRRDTLARSALLLALPVSDEAVATWELEDAFVTTLTRVSGFSSVREVVVNRSGHTGAFELVGHARGLLASGGIERCFLVCVDSYLSEDRLPVWDQAWRLRSARNADGFIPGEAAAALLLEPVAKARARGAPVLATVEAVASAEEPQTSASDQSSSGRGLCRALADVVDRGAAARWVSCDLNGESYRAFEWGLARVRLHEALAGVELLDHPADCTGDVGAATGGILLCHGAWALSHEHPPARDTVLWTAGDDSRRSALRLRSAIQS